MIGSNAETKAEVASILEKTLKARIRELERRVGQLEKHVSDILNQDVRAPLVPEENKPAQNA